MKNRIGEKAEKLKETITENWKKYMQVGSCKAN